MAKNSSILDIKTILDSYTTEIQDGIREITKNVAKEGKEKLRKESGTYTIRSGDYNKGWAVKNKDGARYSHATIHNKTDYRLTHLLENGHATRNGKGRTRSFPHISIVEEYVNTKYQNEIEDMIRRGGK